MLCAIKYPWCEVDGVDYIASIIANAIFHAMIIDSDLCTHNL